MTRNEVDYNVTVDGQDLVLDFDEPITQAGNLNIIVYDVYFPQEGGDVQVEASYVAADGEGNGRRHPRHQGDGHLGP